MSRIKNYWGSDYWNYYNNHDINETTSTTSYSSYYRGVFYTPSSIYFEPKQQKKKLWTKK